MWCGEYVTVVRHVPMKWRNNGNHHHSPASSHLSNPPTGPFSRSLRENRDIMRYMSAIAPEKETRRVFAARLMAEHVFVIRFRDEETPLGDIGLQISPANHEEGRYRLCGCACCAGEGIASEALRAVCDYAFNQTGVKAITRLCWRITAGRCACWKAGFVRTQVLEKGI